MRIKITLSLLAIGWCSSAAFAAPMSMVQTRGASTPEAVAVEAPSSKTNWLTKWWRKPAAQAQPVAVATVAPPTYQPAPAPTAYSHAGMPGATSMAPVRLPTLPAAPPAQITATQGNQQGFPAIGGAGDAVEQLLAQAQAAESQGQIEASRQMLNQCVAQNPTNCLARRRLGHLEDRAGRLAEAEQHYRQAIGCDPTNSAAVNDLGLCLARQGRLELSLATFEQAIRMRPDKPLYRNNVATVLVQLGRVEEALDELNACNEPAVASYNLGHLLLKADKPAEAAEQFRQALAIDATLIPAQSALQRIDASMSADLAALSPPSTPTTPQVAESAPVETGGPEWSPAPAAPPRVAAAPMPAQPVPAGQFPRLLPPVIER